MDVLVGSGSISKVIVISGGSGGFKYNLDDSYILPFDSGNEE